MPVEVKIEKRAVQSLRVLRLMVLGIEFRAVARSKNP